ncbi:MAG: SURF1 family protein [Candidatus Eisenbacteria bacterium]
MKRLPTVAGLFLALVVIAVCVRLGFWQLDRLHEKKALNARLAAALAAPALDLAAADEALAHGDDALRFGRYRVRGRFDETRQFLLMGRAHDGEPGVEVVTPLAPEDGSPAVLVDRGWIPSIDAATAKPERFPAPGLRDVVALAQPILRGKAAGRSTPWRRLEIDSLEVWSVTHLDADSIAARLPYPVRPYVLRALPDAAQANATPIRSAPRAFDETVHLSYAGQWFAFALITFVGSIVLARRKPGA